MALKGVLQGRFSIEKRLGMGGMGEVYQATDNLTGWHVAIKRMLLDEDAPPEAFDPAQKFRGEFETLKALDHPGIPRVLDFFLHESCPCMVMEFIEGQNLEDWISKVRGTGRNWILQEADPVVDRQVIHFGLQLCVILEYIHARHILHRDIKPSNVILRDRTERLALVDFGLARAYSGTRSTKTQVGTLGYCSVEQAQGHPEPRSDVYSLAVTLNHLLTGNQPAPFEVKLLADTRPDLPPRLIAALDKSCAFSAADRLTVAELKRELEGCLLELGSGAPEHTVRPEYFLEQSGTYTEEVEAAEPERIGHYNWMDQALLAGGPAPRGPDSRLLDFDEEDDEDESSGVQRWVQAAKTRQVPLRRGPTATMQVHSFRAQEDEDDLEFIRGLKETRPPIYTHPVVVFLALLALTATGLQLWERRAEAGRIALANRLAVGGASLAREGLRAGPGGSLDLVALPNRPALAVYRTSAPTEISFTAQVVSGSPDLMVFCGESQSGRGATLWLNLEPAELEYRAALTPSTRYARLPPMEHSGMFFQLDPVRRWSALPGERTFFVRLIRAGPSELEARVGNAVMRTAVQWESGCLGLYCLGEGAINIRDLRVTP